MEYHKIDSLFKRDVKGKMLFGAFSCVEFDYLSQNTWRFTEKVDGTNIRVIIANGDVTFGGKTDAAQIPAKLFKRLQERFPTDKVAAEFPDGAVLYGEGYGAGIQKVGGDYRADQDFVLFDVLVGHWWLQRQSVVDVAIKLGIDYVPEVGTGTLHQMIEMVQGGSASKYGKARSEGLVARPYVELKARDGSRIITKLKHKDFGNLAAAT